MAIKYVIGPGDTYIYEYDDAETYLTSPAPGVAAGTKKQGILTTGKFQALATPTEDNDVITKKQLESGGVFDLSGYLKLAGLAGGQTAIGGTAAANSLTLRATSDHVLNGDIILQTGPSSELMRLDGNVGKVGIGIDAPTEKLHVKNATGDVFTKVESVAVDTDAGIHMKNDAIEWMSMIEGSTDSFIIRDSTNTKDPFEVQGNSPTRSVYLTTSAVYINETAADVDLIVKGDTDTTLLVSNAGTDRVGIGVDTPAAKLEINQSNASGAIPCLNLDQDDTDDAFINYEGTINYWLKGSSNINQMGSTAFSWAGAITIEINGVKKYMPYYT